MPSQFPSIQSFFSSTQSRSSSSTASSSKLPFPSVALSGHSSSKLQPSSSSAVAGDGFTAEEIDAVLNPSSNRWTPTADYEEADIGDLQPGTVRVTFMGRIVNFYDQVTPSKRPLAAKGCLKLTVADDTGALTVRLWYANVKYQFQLGQLITIWTVHISQGEHGMLASSTAPLFTSIFPERDRSCYIMIHENRDNRFICKRPYSLKENQELSGLMTVKNFVDGGYDVDNCKILVCVKSIGARKKFTTKKGGECENVHVGIFDDTAEATLTLWGPMTASVSSWRPSHTILLISNPGWKIDRKTWLSLNANTRIDIDPEFNDAVWLRFFAQRLTKKEHINPPFPEGVFDTASVEEAPVRILYRLADIDEFARANPKERFMGYISVLITELNIVALRRRYRFMCTECCGIPLFANATKAKCKQCENIIPLRINPRVLGTVIDETGKIATGKLILSPTAWEQLLGHTTEELMSCDNETLQYLEQRLFFLRVSMGFGWCIEGSELAQDIGNEEDKENNRNVGAGGNEGLRKGKKRKRVDDGDILNSKEKGKVEDGKYGAASAADGVGEVGRLCIWCVKM
ncbi:hypothetical protein GQ43DRAFT_375678 [Delitschia confertaspora ATCC 74209]|uniref:Nucleic acid-binding domain protein n=1 Tax=Delitschia confertaspora ATCC 74209 TaxID=1513339 RepID=A0A9P4JMU1_9PLEO|nr:hypothetical protein GQ43DRAFT_375678 [Delitschia confertaspora ATCC 74209]